MKKLIVSSSLLLVMAFTAVRANEGSRLQTAGQAIVDPYAATGHKTVIVRNILSDELPASLRSHIKEDYKGFWITELYIETSRKESSYFITVEDAGQIVKLTATGSDSWVVTSTTPKDI